MCLRAPTKSHTHKCVLIVYVFTRKTERACVGVQEARWGRGGVTSKLQKKLIKNEKREGAEGGEGR